MAKPQIYSMKWNNYQRHIGGIFVQLLESESMVDLTLCAEGEKISCHRIILSACSPYFQDILAGINSSHPVVILCGISAEDTKSIIEFVYKGELHVSAERFTSILRAAETLKISGLMEVNNHLPVLQVVNTTEGVQAEVIPVPETKTEMNNIQVKDEVQSAEETILENDCEDGSATIELSNSGTEFAIVHDENEDHADFSLKIVTPDGENKKRRRREFSKKDYSEDALSAALEDLVHGRSLLETANYHHIPRSTLYARARSYNITPTITRHEYSEEKIAAAVEAVRGGASLQNASVMFGIPKTVLWRRVQKEIGSYALSRRAKMRQRYLPHVKEAAIKALENGEKINKVSSQYKIPKTTLFREKSRLVDAGKLPLSCLNRRVHNNDSYRQFRLTQAVAACREGRMSQSAASNKFQVSKTTIWRRLNQPSKRNNPVKIEPDMQTEEKDPLQFEELNTSVVSEISEQFSEEKGYPEGSVIILTPNDCGEYQSNQIVVDGMLISENMDDVQQVIEIQGTSPYTEEVCSYGQEVHIEEVQC